MAELQATFEQAKAACKAKEAHIKAVNDESEANERALQDVAGRKQVLVSNPLFFVPALRDQACPSTAPRLAVSVSHPMLSLCFSNGLPHHDMQQGHRELHRG